MKNLTQKEITIIDERFKGWGMEISMFQKSLIDKYISLLKKYSKSANLISRGDIESIFELHILDSLEALSIIGQAVKETQEHKASRAILLDVGSGAGLPGIPLAISLPNAYVDLIEKSSRKCLFLNSVVATLGMQNVGVINQTIEKYGISANINYDFILCRAVKSFPECVKLCGALINRGAKLIYFERRSGGLMERFKIFPSSTPNSQKR